MYGEEEMKKFLSIALAIMMLAGTFNFVLPHTMADSAYLVRNIPAYSAGKGTDQGGGTASNTVETVTLSGRSVLKITPYNSVSAYPSATSITLNCYGLTINAKDLVGSTHVAIRYKYESTNKNAVGKKMGIIMNPNSSPGLASWVNVMSSNTIEANTWTTAIIPIGSDFTSKLVTSAGSEQIKQFQIYLAGRASDGDALAPSSMQGDIFYISDIEFWHGTPDMAEGPDYIAYNVADFFNVPSDANSATFERTVFDGRDAIKIAFNTSYADKTKSYAWKFAEVVNGERQVDLQKYRYVAITYYLDGSFASSTTIAKMKLGVPAQDGLVTSYATAIAPQRIYGKSWSVATFNFSHVSYVPAIENNAKTIHLFPIGDTLNTALNSGSVMYVSQIIFSKKPIDTLRYVVSYTDGKPDGSFRPGDSMTRGEAATLLAGMLAGGDSRVPTNLSTIYTDASSGTYKKYVAYLEKQGVLADFRGTSFYPDKNITRGEFSSLLFRVMQKKNSGTIGESFGMPVDEGDITRAEAITLINSAFGRSTAGEDINGAINYLHTDMSPDYWAFGDVANATLAHFEESASKNWVAPHESEKSQLAQVDSADFAQGMAYVDSVDALEKH